jgi:hypothetical protein
MISGFFRIVDGAASAAPLRFDNACGRPTC